MNSPHYPGNVPPQSGPQQPPQGGYPYPPQQGDFAPLQEKKRKKWPWIVVGLFALAAVGAAASGGAGDQGGSGSPSSPRVAASASPGVSHGLGSKDASADIAVGNVANDPALEWASVSVTVTNHSSKRSNYLIDISLESADGASQIDSTTVVINNLEPGQSATDTGQFTKKAPVGAKAVLKSVDRLAS